MTYRYYTCDVFTETQFGGNPLAVLPDAAGLSDDQMQQIAREFNFSESAFVFPPNSGHTRHVRIFTPQRELPFAGHPNVGTAFVLASAGEFGEIQSPLTVTFEEKAGLVSITIHGERGKVTSCEVEALQPLFLGKAIAPRLVASAVSLGPEDVVTKIHGPQVVSVGFPFVMAELRDRSALQRARINMNGFEALSGEDVPRATQFLANSANYLLAAEVDGALAGFLVAYLVERIDRAASQLFVYELGVAAQHRRHGVGTALMEHVRKVVHEEGLTEAFVFTSRENDAALALYRKTGGQIEDEHSVLFVYPGGAEVARC